MPTMMSVNLGKTEKGLRVGSELIKILSDHPYLMIADALVQPLFSSSISLDMERLQSSLSSESIGISTRC